MKRKHKRLVQLAVTAILGGLVWWAGDHWLVSKPEAAKRTDNIADYVIEQFSATRLNKSGKPQHQLQATRYEFFSASNMAKLVRPHLVQYDASQNATSTWADTGTLDTKNKTLHMKGNVEVRQGKQKHRGPVQLKTNELTVELQ